jgi:hypothetical protein
MPGLTKEQIKAIVNAGDKHIQIRALTKEDVRDVDDFKGRVCHIHNIQAAKRLLKQELKISYGSFPEDLKVLYEIVDSCFQIDEVD